MATYWNEKEHISIVNVIILFVFWFINSCVVLDFLLPILTLLKRYLGPSSSNIMKLPSF